MTPSLDELCACIERQKETVLDFEIVVDDKRHAADVAIDDLREAVRHRDHAARHLADLIALRRGSDV